MCVSTSLNFRFGPFRVQLDEAPPVVHAWLRSFYAPAIERPAPAFSDFHLRLRRPRGPRRWLRPQIRFLLDAYDPFEPYPLSHALPLFEWGLNWCIGTTAHHNLMLHAAVVEKQGRAAILPAMPGAGKSTLCAALIHRGWRLLSDEFGILRHEDGQLLPMPRLVGLKNRSIQVVRTFAPEAVIGPVFTGTRKGDVAHVAPPPESLRRQHETARPHWVIFPRYLPGSHGQLIVQQRSLAFTRLANNAFNYQVTGAAGFRTLTRLAEQCACHQLVYSDLDQAVAIFDRLAKEAAK